VRLNTFEVQELFIVFVDFVFIIIVSVWSLALFVIEVANSITLPQLLMLQVSLLETLKVSCLSNFETAFV
jgi:type IV secretory pathway TrbL component